MSEASSLKLLVDAATPTQKVAAFCKAMMCNLIPDEIWGIDKEGKENHKVNLYHIDSFVCFRRFENLTLHSIYQASCVL